MAAGYCAGFICSSLWNGGGKPLDAIERDEFMGIYPEIEADVCALKADIDDKTRRVIVRYRDDMSQRTFSVAKFLPTRSASLATAADMSSSLRRAR